MEKNKSGFIGKCIVLNKATVNVSLSYPSPEEYAEISSFYAGIADNILLYAGKRAEEMSKQNETARENIKLTFMQRYSDEVYLSYTLDFLESRGGEVINYRRLAQCWDKTTQNLISPRKLISGRLCDGGFFIAGDGIYTVRNLFGREKHRRMSEYISEEKVKLRKKRKI